MKKLDNLPFIFDKKNSYKEEQIKHFADLINSQKRNKEESEKLLESIPKRVKNQINRDTFLGGFQWRSCQLFSTLYPLGIPKADEKPL